MVNKGKVVGTTGIFIALAMIFSYVEAMMPLGISIPGVKLGIANLVVIIAMYTQGIKMGFIINVMRIVAVGFLFTGAFGILYAMSGCIMSYAIMIILKKSKKFSIIGVSMAGGVFHNLGQIIIASIIVESFGVFLYFPILMFAGVFTGIAIGFVASQIIKKLRLTEYVE